uniref:Uncharacterized protein n=1 Tax=Myotis myotis TaxID=51298 RepID=A0A7J7SRM8_MYOMY|nr:hypothetical protein mMyoMyo1_009410 [Myotis myotis]
MRGGSCPGATLKGFEAERTTTASSPQGVAPSLGGRRRGHRKQEEWTPRTATAEPQAQREPARVPAPRSLPLRSGASRSRRRRCGLNSTAPSSAGSPRRPKPPAVVQIGQRLPDRHIRSPKRLAG